MPKFDTKFSYAVDMYNEKKQAWERLKNYITPFKDKQTLDETLDISFLTLKGLKDEVLPMPLWTKIRFAIKQTPIDGESETFFIYRYVAGSSTKQVGFGVNNRLYDHELMLIEPTKILERDTCDNLTFTNVLRENYVVGKLLEPNKEDNYYYSGYPSTEAVFFNWNYPNVLRYVNRYNLDSILNIIDINLMRNVSGSYSGQTITKINADIKLQYNNKNIIILEPNCNVKLDKLGTYKLIYDGFGKGIEGANYGIRLTFEFEVVENEKIKKQITLSTALDRLLAVTPIRREGEAQKYKLSSEARAKYNDLTIPEYYLTGNTLWEALKQLGSFAHAIPYLRVDEKYPNWDTIDFLELGGSEKCNLDTYWSANSYEQDVEQYCTNLDTTVQNIMNTDNELQGTVCEPYNGGFKTVRCAPGEVKLCEDTMLIETTMPIEKIVKLEMKYCDEVLNFTPFIYEQAEYETLSAFYDAYPSKAYALRYKQGQRNVDCLQFKVADIIDQAFQHPVYKNIIGKIKGEMPSSIAIKDIAFRVTYIPHVTMRVKQYKTNATDYSVDNTLLYNQQAHKVDSVAYGEHLKGVVAKLGNTNRVVTYFFNSYDKVPKVGMLTQDGYYVATTACEFWNTYIKCTIELSKDFNKLSEYIGIRNEQRFYEVSEKMSVERLINRSEFAVIGDEVNSNDSIISGHGVSGILNTFLQTEEMRPAGAVNLTAYDDSYGFITGVTLPAVSLAIGNSIALSAKYEDSYSAGNQLKDVESISGVAGVFTNGGKNYIKVQSPMKYTDVWGNIEKLKVEIAEDNVSTTDSPMTVPAQVNAGKKFFSTEGTPFIIKKDSRECLTLTYQMHFVTNRKNIIIGSALAQNCAIVSGRNSAKCAKLVLLNREIGKFEKVITDGVAQNIVLSDLITVHEEYENWYCNNCGRYIGSGWSGNETNIICGARMPNGNICPSGGILGNWATKHRLPQNIKINAFTPNSDCKAWALVTSDKNELLLGVNEAVKLGENSQPIYITYTKKLT